MKKSGLLIAVFTLASGFMAQAIDLTFAVNMSIKIQQGDFDIANDSVDVAGDFNGWGSNLTTLTDGNADSIYFVTISGLSAQQEIEFKFRINGQWDGTEEFSGGGDNRMHTVTNSNDTLEFWYNNELPDDFPPIADFLTQIEEFYSESRTAFLNISYGNVTAIEWHFEGGVPATSTDSLPIVYYADTGSFDVQLIAFNGALSDTITRQDHIKVARRDTTELDWWNDAIFYEVFVRSFYDSDGDGIGDFKGLTEKLDYLNDGDSMTQTDLGVTALWLMPINPSPTYHGYDVTNYKAINPDYGTMQDFQDFLDAAHNRGIRVIMDMVLNHSSTQHPWFIDSKNSANDKRDFYRWDTINPGYSGPWGQNVWHSESSGWYYGLFWSGMPDLNYNNPAVIDSVYDIAEFWLNDIGVDGFRLDAIKYIYEDGSELEDLDATFQFWKDYEVHTEQVSGGSLNVGEAWTNTENVLPYVKDGGLDICFEFDLSSVAIFGTLNGAGQDIGGFAEYIYDVYPHLQWATFLTNHDIDRVFSILNQDIDLNKIAASIYLTLPGVPFIYYGEEIGMTGTGIHENIRTPMQWNTGSQSGFTTGNPWRPVNSNYSVYNVETELADTNSLLYRYRKLIAIRNAKDALRTGRYRSFFLDQLPVMAFLRSAPQDTAMVIVNTGGADLQQISFDFSGTGIQPGSYQWWDMLGSRFIDVEIDGSNTFTLDHLGGYEVMILSPEKIEVEIPVIAGSAEVSSREFQIGLYPNPGSDRVELIMTGADSEAFNLTIYNALGKAIRTIDNLSANRAHTISISTLAKGVYLFSFEKQGRVDTRRFMKN